MLGASSPVLVVTQQTFRSNAGCRLARLPASARLGELPQAHLAHHVAAKIDFNSSIESHGRAAWIIR
jgi:hypothetical protein